MCVHEAASLAHISAALSNVRRLGLNRYGAALEAMRLEDSGNEDFSTAICIRI